MSATDGQKVVEKGKKKLIMSVGGSVLFPMVVAVTALPWLDLPRYITRRMIWWWRRASEGIVFGHHNGCCWVTIEWNVTLRWC